MVTITSKYGSFSPKMFGKYFFFVKIRFQLFQDLNEEEKKVPMATKLEGGGVRPNFI